MHQSELSWLLAPITSSLTASLRIDRALNGYIAEFLTSAVPYPRTHFILSSCAPAISVEKARQELLSLTITRSVFVPASM